MRSTGAYSAPSARSLPLRRSEVGAVALLIGIFLFSNGQISDGERGGLLGKIRNFARFSHRAAAAAREAAILFITSLLTHATDKARHSGA